MEVFVNYSRLMKLELIGRLKARCLGNIGVLIAMEDLDVEEFEVVHIEVVVMLHRSVEGETEGQGIHIA